MLMGNGKFKKQIFGIIGNGTSSWMVMNNTNPVSYTHLKTLIRTLLIIMGAMILAIMVIVLFVSQWMTKPVEEMSSTITRIKRCV